MQLYESESLDLSILMPCRNEASTVGVCIEEAKEFLQKNHIQGEILVIDNDSMDHSAQKAREHGARVITEKKKGYGIAIRTGIAASRGRVLIIGDCDTTYDFLHLEVMYDLLEKGKYDMVIGNRYAGGMEPGSMSLLHRLGVRLLSFLGRIRFHTKVYDFHCGLRGLTREAASKLVLSTEGMEFATEMIAKGVDHQLCIGEVPVILRNCTFVRESKLRTIRDGLRHLGYILIG